MATETGQRMTGVGRQRQFSFLRQSETGGSALSPATRAVFLCLRPAAYLSRFSGPSSLTTTFSCLAVLGDLFHVIGACGGLAQ